MWNTAKPFLEKWMIEQIGPQKLIEELKAQAPRYAKLLPDLPILLADFLKQKPTDSQRDQQVMHDLLAEQRRTNKLLQGIIYGGLGFVLGLIVMQFVVRLHP